MQIMVNSNLCEIKPVCAGMHNSNTAGIYNLKIKCYANRALDSYEKEKICDAVEKLLMEV